MDELVSIHHERAMAGELRYCNMPVERGGQDQPCGEWVALTIGNLRLCQRHKHRVFCVVREEIYEEQRAFQKSQQRYAVKERARQERELRLKTTVYFALREHDGAIKIGRSTNVAQRMTTLGLSLLATMGPGSGDQEPALHRQFARDRLDGEYFRASPELLLLIDRHK